MDVFDVTIVGAGPVGLFASFYAGMRGMSVHLLDALDQLGGQLAALYPEKYIFDVAGFPRIMAKDLVKQLIEQGLQFHPKVSLGEKVQNLAYVDSPDGALPPGKKLIQLTTSQHSYLSRTVILSLGMGAFQPKKLDIPGVARLENQGVYYGVQNKELFSGREIIIMGGGDSACDWVLNLYPLAKKITLVHRRDTFRAHEDSVLQMKSLKDISFKLFYEVKEVYGEKHLESVTLSHNKTGEMETLQADALIINIGFLANLSFLKTWGIEMENNAIKVNERMETSLSGVYGCGDVVTKEGKLKLIATGFGEACTAVNFAKTYMDPTASAFPGHSSNLSETTFLTQ